MILAAKTDKGLVRENNQDSYSIGELSSSACFAIVCDGMGGGAEGALASKECVRIVRERIINSYYDGISDIAIKSLLLNAIEYANKYVWSLSQSEEQYEGMGTTVVAAVVTNEFAYIAHAGDSRAYLLKPKSQEIRQVTIDHSVVQKMLEDGVITQDQIKNHPKKHLITRAVGVDQNIKVDFYQEDILPGNILLICTDGLTNYITVQDILDSSTLPSLDGFVEKLFEIVKNNGSGDNVTVATVSI